MWNRKQEHLIRQNKIGILLRMGTENVPPEWDALITLARLRMRLFGWGLCALIDPSCITNSGQNRMRALPNSLTSVLTSILLTQYDGLTLAFVYSNTPNSSSPRILYIIQSSAQRLPAQRGIHKPWYQNQTLSTIASYSNTMLDFMSLYEITLFIHMWISFSFRCNVKSMAAGTFSATWYIYTCYREWNVSLLPTL